MILFFGMQLIPFGYGILYLLHSIRSRRRSQALLIGVLLSLQLFACAALLWEYLAMP